MKRLMKVLLLISAFMFIAISCSNDKTTGTGSGGNSGGGVTIDSQFLGDYEMLASGTVVSSALVESDGITWTGFKYLSSIMTVNGSTYSITANNQSVDFVFGSGTMTIKAGGAEVTLTKK